MTIKQSVVALLVVALLVALPYLVSESMTNAAIQMLIAALFATAFSLLCGQAGMLSFGHAAYFGLGSFAAVHAMNAFGGEGLLPTPLLPLAGAGVGLLSGLVAGWFSTKRTGVYFAMITLALAELLHALAPHLKGTFGGEAGVSSFRMPAWGFDFGSTTEVYYLALAWVVGSILLLFLLTLTPFGRVTVGLRENTHRLRFLGYNIHVLGTLVFAISAMFAGIAGALQAINIEAANYVVFEAGISTAVVLNSFIGGVGTFFGPAIGAAAMTFFGHVTSDVTRSWLLYQGLIFVLVMMFLPRGLVGEAVERFRNPKGMGISLGHALGRLVALLVTAAGTIMIVELVQRFFSSDYKALASAGNWPPVTFLGREWLPFAVSTWLIPLALFAAGIALLTIVNRHRAKAKGEA
ncbi:branched-chain amino acid ABC transporter permease [Brucella sp. BO3]|uniref:branched-chain amino acid ABC transporter permease n=1 Tax=unclassified Brucella TaxID=2632610 RepID=UPI00084FA93B|nr:MULTISPECIES: branched-chain amino acid ABC transporter permease [unclassified Brucella]OEI83053.1 branched-chain amino acid ABC transporter permease [Brucella sp. B13-0095]QMV27603.1 branched-chain amino acid ABC transporter permease [Brucella sp. BO3]